MPSHALGSCLLSTTSLWDLIHLWMDIIFHPGKLYQACFRSDQVDSFFDRYSSRECQCQCRQPSLVILWGQYDMVYNCQKCGEK
ncbi:hypothetical protein I312_103584 [Cryptococcus bacillisporus CA1280]|uniref:uncharacterized protein n=1 Tax=Cryptococcus bacillisporus CA1280 TaxID=1296109 RepID=UPI0033694125